VGSKGESPVPMKSWSRKTVLMAGKSSREAFTFKTKPRAPTLIASCTISGHWYELKNRILDAGATLRICRAASRPLRFGSPTSSKIRSGCNSSLCWTASKPSEHSPIITRSKCMCSIERIACRHARESSTIKIRLDSIFRGLLRENVTHGLCMPAELTTPGSGRLMPTGSLLMSNDKAAVNGKECVPLLLLCVLWPRQ